MATGWKPMASLIQEEKDRLECLRLAVLFLKDQRTKSDDVLVIAEKFYEFTRKNSRPEDMR